MKRVIISQLLYPKDRVSSQRIKILTENYNPYSKMDHTIEIDRVYIYICLVRDSLQMFRVLVFRDYFETRGHPSSTPPFVRLRETIFL